MNDSHRQTGPLWPAVRLAGRLLPDEEGGCLFTMWVSLTGSEEQSGPRVFHTHTVMSISSAFAPSREQISAKILFSLQFFISVWACRLHRSLAYSLHLALLIQRIAETQTGGSGPVRQHCNSASGPSEWERILAHETRVGIILLLFCSWNPRHEIKCVFHFLDSPQGIRWLLMRLLYQIKRGKKCLSYVMTQTLFIHCCQIIPYYFNLLPSKWGWSCLYKTAKPLLIILKWMQLLPWW